MLETSLLMKGAERREAACFLTSVYSCILHFSFLPPLWITPCLLCITFIAQRFSCKPTIDILVRRVLTRWSAALLKTPCFFCFIMRLSGATLYLTASEHVLFLVSMLLSLSSPIFTMRLWYFPPTNICIHSKILTDLTRSASTQSR